MATRATLSVADVLGELDDAEYESDSEDDFDGYVDTRETTETVEPIVEDAGANAEVCSQRSSDDGDTLLLFYAAVVNSYTLYRQQQHPQGRTLTHEQFRIELVKDLFAARSHLLLPLLRHRQEVLNPQSRLHERHFRGQLGKTATEKQIQQDCTVCSKRKDRGRKTTTFCCKQCQLPMCVVPCFELYHTKVDPQHYL